MWHKFPQLLALATGHEVIAYDRIGFGRSDSHAGDIELNFINKEAGSIFKDVCQHLEVNHFICFGHSVGGSMGVVVAATYPTRCLALIIESSVAFVEKKTITGLKAAKLHFKNPNQIAKLEKYHSSKARWVLNSWLNTWLSDEFTNWNQDTELASVKCPVLIIYGEDDEYGSLKQPQAISRLSGGPSTIKMVANCGHVPHREQQGEVVDLLATFITSISTI